MRRFGTLHSRLLVSYVLVVGLALAAAALALGFLLQGYQDRLTLSRLTDVAVPMAAQIRTMVRLGEAPGDMALRISEPGGRA